MAGGATRKANKGRGERGKVTGKKVVEDGRRKRKVKVIEEG